jgi:FkbM family methyltransferase
MDVTARFDRGSGRIETASVSARTSARLMQVAHAALRPVGYLGISRVFAAIHALSPSRGDIVVLDDGVPFRFPVGDYYWSRLLDRRWRYEPELDGFFRSIRSQPWVFVDLGANYGYWSVRAAAGVYGTREVVAVEAASMCHDVLVRNLAPFGAGATALRRAVASRSGGSVPLYGRRHAGFSLDPRWSGASEEVVDTVSTITLDALLHEVGVRPAETPVVVKLDVEGMERQVLEGAADTAGGQALFLLEDATGAGQVADSVAFARDQLGMRLFVMDAGGSVGRLRSRQDILRHKPRRTRLQQTGLNLVATASPHWWSILEGLA